MRLHDVGQPQRQAQRCLKRLAAGKGRRIARTTRKAVDNVKPQASLRISRRLSPAHQLELSRRQHAQALVRRRDDAIEVHALHVRLKANLCLPDQVAIRRIGHQLDAAVALLDIARTLQHIHQLAQHPLVRLDARAHRAFTRR